MTATETIESVAAELGLSMTAEFVPWSQSRNKGEKSPSLNWRVTIKKKRYTSDADGNEKPAGETAILTTDYMAGSGHCPSYKQGDSSIVQREVIKFECENGVKGIWRDSAAHVGPYVSALKPREGKRPIAPKFADVLHSLVLDASVIDYGLFENWAEDLGYDADSRKAEAIYRQCLEIALKLRNAIGEDGLTKLRDACQDY